MGLLEGKVAAPPPPGIEPAALARFFAARIPGGDVPLGFRLIESGGPFPYPKDGTEFQNREARLPRQPRGHYHEYTVPTPGSEDRGARRIVTGGHGEIFYTDDHYRTFRWVERR